MPRRTALVGYSGFVGGVLQHSRAFDVRVNRRDGTDLGPGHFDEVVCAGAPAEKWLANQDPSEDQANLRALMELLRRASIGRLILISTVDVYPRPVDVDEATPIDPAEVEPYGRHRLLLESFVRDEFSDHLIVRLPALFGPGLKKNLIFDLLHDRPERFADARSRFQFYDVRRLAADLDRFAAASLRLVNVTSPPMSAAAVAETCFGRSYDHTSQGGAVAYDVRSRHAEEFGGSPAGYVYPPEVVIRDLQQFVAEQRGRP